MIVLWRVSTDCNLACGFCAYDRRLPFARERIAMREVERFGGLLGELQRVTGESVLLSWLGGEPLLWPALLALSQTLHQREGLRISATTNGTTLHQPAVRAAVLDSFAELTVSIDAIGEGHDALRGWRHGWRRLQTGVHELAQLRRSPESLRLRANVVLMHSTVAELPNLCDTLADWGIDEITINQLGGNDRPDFHAQHKLLPADVEHLRRSIDLLRPALAERGVRLCADESYLDRFEASARGVPRPVERCRLAERMLFIDERGHVAPCSFTTGAYGTPTSTLTTVEALIALRQSLADRQSAAPARACGDCPSTQVFGKFAA